MRMPESITSANERLACLSCGASWASIIRLRDGRIVRACDECLHTTVLDWSSGSFAPREGLPVRLGDGSIMHVPWPMVAPHRDQIFSNHRQTLEQIALRGGLSAWEAVLVLSDEPLLEIFNTAQDELDQRSKEKESQLAEMVSGWLEKEGD